MQFNDITKAVNDAWEFSWPPLFICIIVYIISCYLNPVGTKFFLLQAVGNTKIYGKKIDQFKTILEPYGLTKVIPIAFVIIFISFLYLINNPIMLMASYLPPHISYSPDILNKNRMSQEERLLLVRKYPTARHFNEAYFIALQNLKKDDKAPINRSQIYYTIHNFVKLAFVLSVIFIIINCSYGSNVFYQFLKFVLIFLILACVWLICLVGLLYQQEQQFYTEWRPIQLTLQTDAELKLKLPITEQEKAKIKDEARGRWWRIYFVNKYGVSWIRRTFID